MKTAVIYKSKYGATKTYAKWLAEDLSADLLESNRVKPSDLQRYETILYGGGIYVGSVSGISLLTKNFEQIKNKNLYLFTVGAGDVNDPEVPKTINNTLKQKLPPAIWEKVHVYHMRGGMQYSKMSFLHRSMMKMMVKMVRKKPENELTAHDQYLLKTYGQDVVVSDRTAISSLVADVKAGAGPQ